MNTWHTERQTRQKKKELCRKLHFLEIEARQKIAWNDEKQHCFELLQIGLSRYRNTNKAMTRATQLILIWEQLLEGDIKGYQDQLVAQKMALRFNKGATCAKQNRKQPVATPTSSINEDSFYKKRHREHTR